MSSLWFRFLRPMLVGHLSGFGALLVLSMIALSASDPSALALPLALSALSLGALICGIVSRKTSLGLLGGVVAGLLFALIPWILSLFSLGKESAGMLTFGQSSLAALALWVIASLPPAFTPKKKKSGSLSRRRRAMQQRFR